MSGPDAHDAPQRRLTARELWAISQTVELPRRVRLGPALATLVRLATFHRRHWGPRGIWGRENPFRRYDRENGGA
jgi:hypothetical protein